MDFLFFTFTTHSLFFFKHCVIVLRMTQNTQKQDNLENSDITVPLVWQWIKDSDAEITHTEYLSDNDMKILEESPEDFDHENMYYMRIEITPQDHPEITHRMNIELDDWGHGFLVIKSLLFYNGDAIERFVATSFKEFQQKSREYYIQAQENIDASSIPYRWVHIDYLRPGDKIITSEFFKFLKEFNSSYFTDEMLHDTFSEGESDVPDFLEFNSYYYYRLTGSYVVNFAPKAKYFKSPISFELGGGFILPVATNTVSVRELVEKFSEFAAQNPDREVRVTVQIEDLIEFMNQ